MGSIQYCSYPEVRVRAIRELLNCSEPSETTFNILIQVVQSDSDWVARSSAILQLFEFFPLTDEVINIFFQVAKNDPFDINKRDGRGGENPRGAALLALIKADSKNVKIYELLRDRALNDPDEQLREWAQQQLEKLEITEEAQ